MKIIIAIVVLIAGVLLVACGGGEAKESTVVTPTASPAASPEPTVVVETPTVEENLAKIEAALTGELYGYPAFLDPEGDFGIYWDGEWLSIGLTTDGKANAAAAFKVLQFFQEVGVQDHCNPELPIRWSYNGSSEGFPFCPRPGWK